MGSPDGLSSVTSESFPYAEPERTFEAVERLRLTVKAASMKEWMKPDATFESLPAIWMVTVESLGQGYCLPLFANESALCCDSDQRAGVLDCRLRTALARSKVVSKDRSSVA